MSYPKYMYFLRCHIQGIYHEYLQVAKDICRIYQDWYSIYHIYDNIKDYCRHFEDNFRKSVISLSYMLHVIRLMMWTGREFKDTTYPDDSLEFPTRLNINQGCDILEQDIPDVVISQVYTKYIHKTRKYIFCIEYI